MAHRSHPHPLHMCSHIGIEVHPNRILDPIGMSQRMDWHHNEGAPTKAKFTFEFIFTINYF